MCVCVCVCVYDVLCFVAVRQFAWCKYCFQLIGTSGYNGHIRYSLLRKYPNFDTDYMGKNSTVVHV